MQRLALGIIVVVVVFTAVVAGVLIRNRRATLAETVPASSADLTVKEVNIREESGKLRWHLIAKQAMVFEREERTSLREVKVEVEEPDRTWVIRGAEGELFHGRNDLEIRGDVVLTSSDGLRLDTTVLRWSNKDKRVWTDAPVRITHASGVITGSALEVRVSEETTTVSGRVKATFERRPAS